MKEYNLICFLFPSFIKTTVKDIAYSHEIGLAFHAIVQLSENKFSCDDLFFVGPCTLEGRVKNSNLELTCRHKPSFMPREAKEYYLELSIKAQKPNDEFSSIWEGYWSSTVALPNNVGRNGIAFLFFHPHT